MIGSEMLTGAGIAIGAFLAGQWLPRPHHGRPKAPKPVLPICGCEHHFSYHDPQTGECHGKIDVANPRPDYDTPTTYHKEPCSCRKYTGPEPLPEYYAPEIGA